MSDPWKRREVIGDATLYLGDCLEILPTLPKVDAVITDPPYGLNFPYLSYADTDENFSVLVSSVMPKLLSGADRLVVTPGNTNIHKYPPPNWIAAWTWDTTTARGKLGWSQWQPILFYGEDVCKGTANWNGKLKSDRIHFSGGAANIDASAGGDHPCAKPEEFMRKLVARFSDGKQSVLDPFMGSGTTGVACMNLGRKFIGIEIEERYFNIAVERITNAQRQQKLFDAPSNGRPEASLRASGSRTPSGRGG